MLDTLKLNLDKATYIKEGNYYLVPSNKGNIIISSNEYSRIQYELEC